ncbi:MAG: hypothetical protein AVDCRST_MAG21-1450, partial [uncultured Nocardioidaceae bacterium]
GGTGESDRRHGQARGEAELLHHVGPHSSCRERASLLRPTL